MNYVQVLRREIATEVIYRSRGRWDITQTPRLLDSYALLVLAVGEDVTTELVHDAWALDSNATHGPHHPRGYLVPFAELAPEVQAQDELGRAVIAAVARRRTGRTT